MKKLLTILGSLAIVTSGSLLVVSCGTKEEDNNTGSLFIDTNGELKIDSEALMDWYQENNGDDKNIKHLKEFLQLFAVAVMSETEKDDSIFKDLVPTSTSNQYVLENFQTEIKTAWGEKNSTNGNTVQGAANNAWERKEREAKENDGDKNYRENLVNSLAKEFPYVKKDFETLKKAYINNEILQGKDTNKSALATLTQILTGTYSKTYSNNELSKDTLLSSFIGYWDQYNTNDLETEIGKYVNSADTNKNDPKYTNLVNLINATGGQQTNEGENIPGKWIALPADDGGTNDRNIWDLTKVRWLKKSDTISSTLIKDLLYRLDANYHNDKTQPSKVTGANFKGSNTVFAKWSYVNGTGDNWNSARTYFNLINSYPNYDFERQTANGAGVYGLLTNSQRFIVDQYFAAEKPISLSEVVFKKASDTADLTRNINGQNFINPTNNETAWEQFFGFYNFLKNYVSDSVTEDGAPITTAKGVDNPIKGTSQYNFDTIFTQNSSNPSTEQIRLRNSGTPNRFWSTNYYTATTHDKLLSLSSGSADFSDILKFSVYDFIQATGESDSNPGHKELETYNLNPGTLPALTIPGIRDYLFSKGFDDAPATTIATSIMQKAPVDTQLESLKGLCATLNLIEKINRKTVANQEYSSSEDQANNKVYQVLNPKQGIIAFVDTDGLHVTKINGYDILLNPKQEQSSNQLKGNEIAYINQVNAFKRLAAYDTPFSSSDTNRSTGDISGNYRYIFQDYFNNISQDNGDEQDSDFTLISTDIVQKVKSYGVHYQDLNQSITNPYERFLVNNSILTTSTGAIHTNKPPLYKFDLLKNVQDAIAINASEDTLSTNSSWIWDYIKTILNLQTDRDLIDKFFKFEDSKSSRKIRTIYLKKLALNSERLSLTAYKNLTSGWDEWNKKIDDSKDISSEINKDLPLMKLSYGTDQSHITNLQNMQAFKPFKSDSEVPSNSFKFVLDFNNYWNFNFTLNNKKGGKE